MKKILIGAVLASSLAVGGDVAKCTEAVFMMDTLEQKIDKTAKNDLKLHKLKHPSNTAKEKKFLQNAKKKNLKRGKMLYSIQSEWMSFAKEHCAGIWDDEILLEEEV